MQPQDQSIAVIVVAAGSGTRAGGLPKQYRSIGRRPILARSLGAFMALPAIGRIVCVIDPAFEAEYRTAIDGLADDPRLTEPVAGGATRQASVLAGLEALAPFAPDLVLIHDAARPILPAAVTRRLIAGLAVQPGAIPVLPVVDSLAEERDGVMLSLIHI